MDSADTLVNVVVLAADPVAVQEHVAGLDRRHSDSVDGFVRVTRRATLFQLVFASDPTADVCAFASLFVIVGEGEEPSLQLDRLQQLLKRECVTIFVGRDSKQLAGERRSPWLRSLNETLFDLLEGAARLSRPVSEKMLADRLSMAANLADPQQLAGINKKIKSAGLKPALDLYLAADSVDNYEACVRCVSCPQMIPFLLSRRPPEPVSVQRKTAVLAAIQDEVLRLLHPALTASAATSSVSPVAAIDMSRLVVTKNLSNVESLIVCDQSRWHLLRAVLLATQFDALSEPAPPTLSPRPTVLSGTLGRKAAPVDRGADEGAFVWDSVEAVLTAHAQQYGFCVYLVEEDMTACGDVMRLFREDSVSTKWMARLVKRSLPALQAVLRDAVSHVMYGTLSVDDEPNSLVLLLALFKAITQLDFSLELRLCLARCREVCERMQTDPVIVCGRLVLLRWIGPLLLNPALLVGKSAGPEQLEQLKIACKLLVHVGEGTQVLSGQSLAVFNGWLSSVSDQWREYVVTLWSSAAIATKRRSVRFENTRSTREYALHLAALKEALQRARASGVPCKDWGDVLGVNRKSLEL